MAVTHGGSIGLVERFPSAQPSVAGAPAAAATAPAGEVDARGYRHFLGRPTRRFTVTPRPDKEADPEIWTRTVLGTLGYIMADRRTSAEQIQPSLNRNLPSGYTYLLQFIAHDCVQTSTPFWALPDGSRLARNGRVSRLRLETLYGDGPAACPYAFAADNPGDTVRTRLRLGPMAGPAGQPQRLRDLARIAAPAMPFAEPSAGVVQPVGPATASGPPLGDPLIVDPRNEDNALLAQVTTLFHMLHNTMVGLLGLTADKGGNTPEGLRDGARRFACARHATIAVYRRVLRRDLLRRLLHPAVWSTYMHGDAATILDRDPRHNRGFVSVPMEFSHGSVRFAHSMVRPFYDTTDKQTGLTVERALLATSARGPDRMPLSTSWILRWGNFFDTVSPIALVGTPPTVNYSLRIGPHYTVALSDSVLFPPPFPSKAGNGLAFQDMMSAASAGLWSVEPLMKAVRRRMAKKGWNAAFLNDAKLGTFAARKAAILAWLSARKSTEQGSWQLGPLDETALDSLAADPPLPFYILFEAEHEMCGERLGPLGSILIGDVMFGAMLDDPLPGDGNPNATLGESLEAIANAFGVPGAFGQVPDFDDMAGLVGFVARQNDLGSAQPPFL